MAYCIIINETEYRFLNKESLQDFYSRHKDAFENPSEQSYKVVETALKESTSVKAKSLNIIDPNKKPESKKPSYKPKVFKELQQGQATKVNVVDLYNTTVEDFFQLLETDEDVQRAKILSSVQKFLAPYKEPFQSLKVRVVYAKSVQDLKDQIPEYLDSDYGKDIKDLFVGNKKGAFANNIIIINSSAHKDDKESLLTLMHELGHAITGSEERYAEWFEGLIDSSDLESYQMELDKRLSDSRFYNLHKRFDFKTPDASLADFDIEGKKVEVKTESGEWKSTFELSKEVQEVYDKAVSVRRTEVVEENGKKKIKVVVNEGDQKDKFGREVAYTPSTSIVDSRELFKITEGSSKQKTEEIDNRLAALRDSREANFDDLSLLNLEQHDLVKVPLTRYDKDTGETHYTFDDNGNLKTIWVPIVYKKPGKGSILTATPFSLKSKEAKRKYGDGNSFKEWRLDQVLAFKKFTGIPTDVEKLSNKEFDYIKNLDDYADIRVADSWEKMKGAKGKNYDIVIAPSKIFKGNTKTISSRTYVETSIKDLSPIEKYHKTRGLKKGAIIRYRSYFKDDDGISKYSHQFGKVLRVFGGSIEVVSKKKDTGEVYTYMVPIKNIDTFANPIESIYDELSAASKEIDSQIEEVESSYGDGTYKRTTLDQWTIFTGYRKLIERENYSNLSDQEKKSLDYILKYYNPKGEEEILTKSEFLKKATSEQRKIIKAAHRQFFLKRAKEGDVVRYAMSFEKNGKLIKGHTFAKIISISSNGMIQVLRNINSDKQNFIIENIDSSRVKYLMHDYTYVKQIRDAKEEYEKQYKNSKGNLKISEAYEKVYIGKYGEADYNSNRTLKNINEINPGDLLEIETDSYEISGKTYDYKKVLVTKVDEEGNIYYAAERKKEKGNKKPGVFDIKLKRKRDIRAIYMVKNPKKHPIAKNSDSVRRALDQDIKRKKFLSFIEKKESPVIAKSPKQKEFFKKKKWFTLKPLTGTDDKAVYWKDSDKPLKALDNQYFGYKMAELKKVDSNKPLNFDNVMQRLSPGSVVTTQYTNKDGEKRHSMKMVKQVERFTDNGEDYYRITTFAFKNKGKGEYYESVYIEGKSKERPKNISSFGDYNSITNLRIKDKLITEGELASRPDVYVNSKDMPENFWSKLKSPADQVVLLQNVLNDLQERFPNVNASLVSNQEMEELQKQTGYFNENEDYKALIFNGEIFINKDKASTADVLHEYSHIAMSLMKYEDPEAYNEIINAALQHPYYKEMKALYSNKSDEEVAEEVFVTLLGEKLANPSKFEQESDIKPSLFKRAVNAIKRFWAKIFKNPVVSKVSDEALFTANLGELIAKYGTDNQNNLLRKAENSSFYNKTQDLDIDYISLTQEEFDAINYVVNNPEVQSTKLFEQFYNLSGNFSTASVNYIKSIKGEPIKNERTHALESTFLNSKSEDFEKKKSAPKDVKKLEPEINDNDDFALKLLKQQENYNELVEKVEGRENFEQVWNEFKGMFNYEDSANKPDRYSMPDSMELAVDLDPDKKEQKVELPIDVEPIQPVLDILYEQGAKIHVVGGSVRDAVFGNTPKDVDLEIYHMESWDIAKVLKEHGKILEDKMGVIKWKPFSKLDDPDFEEYDITLPRTEKKVGAGHTGFQITTDKDMDITEASLRRDFTWNALSYDVMTKTVYDPFGGIADLKNRVLRHTNDFTFKQDPLRVLRGMQFQARMGLTVAPETIKVMREVVESGAMEELPAERFRGEWTKWAQKGKYNAEIFNFLRETKLGEYMYPNLMLLKDTLQDPVYHPEGDVEEHTKQVLAKANEIAERENLKGEERALLLINALFHDIAKPETTEIIYKDKLERLAVTARGHEPAGGPIVEKFLKDMKFSGKFAERANKIVTEHLAHATISAIDNPKGQRSAFRKLIKRVGLENIDQLIYLMEADMLGRNNADQGTPITIELFKDLLKQYKEENKGKKFKPSLTGKDLIDKGFKPGPIFGKLTKILEEAEMDELFTGRDEGLEWLSNYLTENREDFLPYIKDPSNVQFQKGKKVETFNSEEAQKRIRDLGKKLEERFGAEAEYVTSEEARKILADKHKVVFDKIPLHSLDFDEINREREVLKELKEYENIPPSILEIRDELDFNLKFVKDKNYHVYIDVISDTIYFNTDALSYINDNDFYEEFEDRLFDNYNVKSVKELKDKLKNYKIEKNTILDKVESNKLIEEWDLLDVIDNILPNAIHFSDIFDKYNYNTPLDNFLNADIPDYFKKSIFEVSSFKSYKKLVETEGKRIIKLLSYEDAVKAMPKLEPPNLERALLQEKQLLSEDFEILDFLENSDVEHILENDYYYYYGDIEKKDQVISSVTDTKKIKEKYPFIQYIKYVRKDYEDEASIELVDSEGQVYVFKINKNKDGYSSRFNPHKSYLHSDYDYDFLKNKGKVLSLNKLGSIDLGDNTEVVHVTSAYNDRTSSQVFDYWFDNFSKSLDLMESAATVEMDKGSELQNFKANESVYVTFDKEETDYLFYSPYDSFTYSMKGNDKFKNLKYITEQTLHTDPEEISSIIKNKKANTSYDEELGKYLVDDYDEWVIRMTPASLKDINVYSKYPVPDYILQFNEVYGIPINRYIIEEDGTERLVESYESKPDLKVVFKKDNKQVKGFFDSSSNKPYVVIDKADESTPVHEIFTHPFLNALKKENVQLYNNLLTEANKNEKLVETVKRYYKNQSREVINDEIIAAAIDMYVNNELDYQKDKGLIAAIKRFFSYMSSKLRKVINNDVSIKEFDPSLTLREIAGYSLYGKGSINEIYKDAIKFQRSLEPTISNKESIAEVKKMAEKMEERFGVGFTLLTEEEMFSRTKEQGVKGFWNPKEKRAYLNIDTFDKTTPVHEIFSHPFIEVVQRQKPELYNSLLEEAKKDSIIVDKIENQYPDYSQEDKDHEIIAHGIDKYIRKELNKEHRGLIEKIQDFFNYISDTLSSFINKKDATIHNIPNNTTLEDLAKYTLYGKGKINLTNALFEAFSKKETVRLNLSTEESVERLKNEDALIQPAETSIEVKHGLPYIGYKPNYIDVFADPKKIEEVYETAQDIANSEYFSNIEFFDIKKSSYVSLEEHVKTQRFKDDLKIIDSKQFAKLEPLFSDQKTYKAILIDILEKTKEYLKIKNRFLLTENNFDTSDLSLENLKALKEEKDSVAYDISYYASLWLQTIRKEEKPDSDLDLYIVPDDFVNADTFYLIDKNTGRHLGNASFNENILFISKTHEDYIRTYESLGQALYRSIHHGFKLAQDKSLISLGGFQETTINGKTTKRAAAAWNSWINKGFASYNKEDGVFKILKQTGSSTISLDEYVENQMTMDILFENNIELEEISEYESTDQRNKAVYQVLKEIGKPEYYKYFRDNTDGLPLIANMANNLAKNVDYNYYALKPGFMREIAIRYPTAWADTNQGILYAETPVGQVSFHVFNDEDALANQFGLSSEGREWDDNDAQYRAESLLDDYVELLKDLYTSTDPQIKMVTDENLLNNFSIEEFVSDQSIKMLEALKDKSKVNEASLMYKQRPKNFEDGLNSLELASKEYGSFDALKLHNELENNGQIEC